MNNRYEVMVFGDTLDDTDATFSFLIRADSPEQAQEKAEQIMESVLIHSCEIVEVECLDV